MKSNLVYLLSFKGSMDGDLYSGSSKIIYTNQQGEAKSLNLEWSTNRGKRGQREGLISAPPVVSWKFEGFEDFEEKSPMFNSGSRPTVIVRNGTEVAERFIYPKKKKETRISKFLPPYIKRDPFSYKGYLYDSWLRLTSGNESADGIHDTIAFALKCHIEQTYRFIALSE